MRLPLALLLLILAAPVAAAAQLAVEEKPDRVVITDGSQPVATYVFHDKDIRRPYWTAVHAPGGRLLTRRHPPVEGKDPIDHATMHPGIWLAFGDMSGADFWRNKATVRHVRFVDPPVATDDQVQFTAENAYIPAAGNEAIATETCRVRLLRRPHAYLLTIDSTIVPTNAPLVFGDQEEMGLGVRVATELTVKNGGVILNSNGERNEKGTWGKPAEWCAYSAALGGRHAGVAILAHPDNVRASRFHSRDYGLLVANPFAIEAFRAGPKASTQVTTDKPLRLRFGILLYDDVAPPDVAAEYESFTAPARR
jgi:hypothetical protein